MLMAASGRAPRAEQHARVARVLLVASLVAAVVLSSLSIAVLADHDCSGDGCEQCAVIQLACALLATPLLPASSGGRAIVCACACMALFLAAIYRPTDTSLVGVRVRLDS